MTRDLFRGRVGCYRALDNLPEGVLWVGRVVSLDEVECARTITIIVDTVNPRTSGNMSLTHVVPPANEKPRAAGHVCTVVPFGNLNWWKDLAELSTTFTSDRVAYTHMFRYVCTKLTGPLTGASFWLMSVLAPSTCFWPMILLDSKSEMRKPGPLSQ